MNIAIKQIIFSLKRCMLQYQVKKTKKLFINNDNNIINTFITNAVAKTIILSFIIIIQAYNDNKK